MKFSLFPIVYFLKKNICRLLYVLLQGFRGGGGGWRGGVVSWDQKVKCSTTVFYLRLLDHIHLPGYTQSLEGLLEIFSKAPLVLMPIGFLGLVRQQHPTPPTPHVLVEIQ